jgi:hypothetical protein
MIDDMFIVIGLVGAVLLLSSLLFDDFTDDVLPDLDFLSSPVIAASLAAFGLFGWFASSYDVTPTLVAVGAAGAGGLVLAEFSYQLAQGLLNQPTDAARGTSRT